MIRLLVLASLTAFAVPAAAQLRGGLDAPPPAADLDWIHARDTGLVRDGLTQACLPSSRGAQCAWVGRAAIVEPAGAPRWTGVSARRLSSRPELWRVEGGPGEDGRALAARLLAEGVARRAMPDLSLARAPSAISVPPNDPRYGGQWYLQTIGIEDAWAIETGDPAVSIVIVDNGCEMTHPDLAAAFLGGRDVRDMDDDPSPDASEPGAEHGTACAGIAAGIGDNGIGIAGVCPECTLHCVRLLGPRGSLTPLSADIAAFEYARSVGARVVSNSWGFVEAISAPPMLRSVVEGLFDDGVLVVFAAGNDNRELYDDELTGLRGVIAVGALNLFDEVAPFSNFGPSLDLTAPTGTLSTDLTGPAGASPDDYTTSFGGTSSSCPVVAGVAGLLFSAAPSATAREVHDALIATTRPAPFAEPDARGHDPLHGYGIVSPAAALRALTGMPAPSDAGVPASDAGPTESPPQGCSCRAAPAGAAPAWIALALGVLLSYVSRRVNRRSGPGRRS